ncbi:hypothetical protein Fmac_024494 [Flemingia macrophylla]|uniref:Uncharacterized protein n=1 Tax=Flemingia macrophylla TaxID=520843 RepID=A0ABD1LPK0_9FABA
MVEQQQRSLCQAQLRPMPAPRRFASEVSGTTPAEATPEPSTPSRNPPTPTTPPRLSLAPPKPRSPSELLVNNAACRPNQSKTLNSSSSTTPPPSPPPPPLNLTLSFPVSHPVLFFHPLAPTDYVMNIPHRDTCGFERPAVEFRRGGDSVSLCHGVLLVVLPSLMEPPYLGPYQRPQVLFAPECLQASLYDSVELLQPFNLFFVGVLTRER